MRIKEFSYPSLSISSAISMRATLHQHLKSGIARADHLLLAGRGAAHSVRECVDRRQRSEEKGPRAACEPASLPAIAAPTSCGLPRPPRETPWPSSSACLIAISKHWNWIRHHQGHLDTRSTLNRRLSETRVAAKNQCRSAPHPHPLLHRG